MSYQYLLERLGKLYEFRNLIVTGRRRGFLEHSEALKLVKLLRDIVTDLSHGEARLTLYLLDVIEKMVCDPGPIVKSVAKEKFSRDDVLPVPEHLVDSLPEPPLLELVRSLAKTSLPLIGVRLVDILAQRIGLSSSVTEALLSIRLKDLVRELGYLFESLLHMAENYARILEDYVLTHGLGELKLSGTTLSAFAEVVARAWLATVLKGPWARAEPLAYQAKRAQYEFDAVSIERIEDRVEVYVAEVEVRCSKFLEPEERRPNITSIEGKVQRLKYLLETIANAYKPLGAKRACLSQFLLICFDTPSQGLKDQIITVAGKELRKLASKELCPSFSTENSIQLIDSSKLLQSLSRKPPGNRLREAVERIIKLVRVREEIAIRISRKA